jgi:adenosylcobinamide-GDP ribazoletransferase
MTETTEESPAGPPAAAAAWWADLRLALAFLTRLPVPIDGAPPPTALARASRTFPLAGLIIGLVGGLVFALATALSLSSMLAAILTVAVTVAVTGALHEDGLADTADGFGGGATREDKLAIMRDSRIGSFGVLALILAIAARVASLAALGTPAAAFAALVAVHAASRAFVVAVMEREPLARSDGMAASAGRPSRACLLWALGLAALITIVVQGLAGIVALAVGAAVAWALARLARRQIGGYTGDVLGAVQQASEIAMLLAIVALS